MIYLCTVCGKEETTETMNEYAQSESPSGWHWTSRDDHRTRTEPDILVCSLACAITSGEDFFKRYPEGRLTIFRASKG